MGSKAPIKLLRWATLLSDCIFDAVDVTCISFLCGAHIDHTDVWEVV